MEIASISFKVSAQLGSVTLSQLAYSDLQLGDILILDQLIQEPLKIYVGKQQCFQGSPGLFRSHKAVNIDERINS